MIGAHALFLVLAVLATGCIGRTVGGGATPSFARSHSPRPMATARISPPPSGPETAALLGTPRARGGARPTPPPERRVEPAAFSQALVRTRLESLRLPMRDCYEAHLRRVPAAAGRVVVEFTVAPGGATEGVVASEDTVGSPDLAACVVRLVDALSLAPGPGGVSVSYRYPFVFAPSQ